MVMILMPFVLLFFRYHFLKAIDSCVYENCGLDDYDYDGGLVRIFI